MLDDGPSFRGFSRRDKDPLCKNITDRY